jgi:hypothetical protein
MLTGIALPFGAMFTGTAYTVPYGAILTQRYCIMLKGTAYLTFRALLPGSCTPFGAIITHTAYVHLDHCSKTCIKIYSKVQSSSEYCVLTFGLMVTGTAYTLWEQFSHILHTSFWTIAQRYCILPFGAMFTGTAYKSSEQSHR